MNHHLSIAFLLVSASASACSGQTIDVGAFDAGTAGDTSSASGGDGGSEGGGFAGCDINDVVGTFEVSYTQLSGNCGALPSAEYSLLPNWPWNMPGCIVKSKSTSADRCTSTGSADCTVNASDELVSGSITQLSADAISGKIDIQITNATAQCAGSYTIDYRRKP